MKSSYLRKVWERKDERNKRNGGKRNDEYGRYDIDNDSSDDYKEKRWINMVVEIVEWKSTNL